MHTLLGALLVTTFATTDPPKQPAAPASDPPSETTWSVAAGYETWSLRDIARTSFPTDGSPVSMESSGPAVAVRYERARRRRLHRFDLGVASAIGFDYVTLGRRTKLSSSGRIVRGEGRYEYRRYPFIDVIIDGFDLGIGIQGNIVRRSLSREWPGAVTLRQTETELGFTVPIVARLQRWARAEIDVAWSTGLSIGRSRQLHSAGTGIEDAYGGGGGTSELAARARLRISSQVRLATTYVASQDWRFSSHRAYSARRTQLALGVSYER